MAGRVNAALDREGHLMSRKVKLALLSMLILWFRIWGFTIIFDYIRPDINEHFDLVRFW